jgi:hypothetical protein
MKVDLHWYGRPDVKSYTEVDMAPAVGTIRIFDLSNGWRLKAQIMSVMSPITGIAPMRVEVIPIETWNYDTGTNDGFLDAYR